MTAENTRKTPHLAEVGRISTMLERLNSLPPLVANGQPVLQHPVGELTTLLGSLQHALSGQACPVVQFTSAYAGEGAASIGFDMAVVAARQSGKRTLFINLNAAPDGGYAPLAQRAGVSLEAFLSTEGGQTSPLVTVQGIPLFYAEMAIQHGAQLAALNTGFVRNLLADLRGHFDLIVLASEGGIAQSATNNLGALTDGMVLVVEAERTRAPVVEQLRQQIEAAGGRLLGSVLNRRRFYIPAAIYNLLFGRR